MPFRIVKALGMSMPSYKAIVYRQALSPDAPLLVSFIVSAEELLGWAGIPRRAEGDLIGFQRAPDPNRVAKASEFFKIPHNQSPTSLIVGLHPRDANSGLLSIEFMEEMTAEKSAVECVISVADNLAELASDEAVEAVRTQVASRLVVDSNNSDLDDTDWDETVSNEADERRDKVLSQIGSGDEDDVVLTVDDSDDFDQLSDSDDSDQGDGDDQNAVELAASILRRLVEKLDDPDWVEGHLDDLRELAKPATIIDGQHRVLGAAALERNIPFNVTAILDCPWSEQVFQFTVVNYTARGIPEQFITANAALSLTSSELDTLEDRLIQAGVKVIEYELMTVVNFDERSPFFQKVTLTEKSKAHLIGYRTMVRIAKAWYLAKDPAIQLIVLNLYPDLAGEGRALKQQRMARWSENDWGDFFLAFWNTVHDRYANEPSHRAGETLWTVGKSQLMVAIVLFKLQEAFIENLGAQDPDFFETNTEDPIAAKALLIGKIKKRAELFLGNIPAKFFATKWSWTGLNIGPGRAALEQAFANLIRKKGKYQYARSALVTGKADSNS